MEAQIKGGMLFQGEHGYVWMSHTTHGGKQGVLLYYANPDPGKLHVVDTQGMRELERAIEILETTVDSDPALSFCIIHGAFDPVHAGADITQFAGDPDFDQIREHLNRGTMLDVRIKQLWPKIRTVAIFAGDRYGGSVEWPLFAQWAVADTRTRIQFSEVHLGIVPGWNGVLNSILRTHPANVRCIAQTGNPADASQLLQMGLVQSVVNTPAPPDRRKTLAAEWPIAWAAHAEVCQDMLLKEALALATQDAEPRRLSGFRLCTDEDLGEEIRRRTDVARYRALRARFEPELQKIDAQAHPEKLKELSREIGGELNRIGKPLAPKSVAALSQYVQRWSAMSKRDLIDRYEEAARQEAAICDELMHTPHRKIGVNAILSRSPIERIPLFD